MSKILKTELKWYLGCFVVAAISQFFITYIPGPDGQYPSPFVGIIKSAPMQALILYGFFFICRYFAKILVIFINKIRNKS